MTKYNNALTAIKNTMSLLMESASPEHRAALAKAIQILDRPVIRYDHYMEIRSAFAKVLNHPDIYIGCDNYHTTFCMQGYAGVGKKRVFLNYNPEMMDICFGFDLSFSDKDGYCSFFTNDHELHVVVTSESGLECMNNLLDTGSIKWGYRNPNYWSKSFKCILFSYYGGQWATQYFYK